mgnify:CR=1 FL=1
MPIFEYLCPDCNRVYNFLVKSLASAKQPVCPKCGAGDLRKMVSKFAVGSGHRPASPSADEDGPSSADDPRLEREMMKLMADAEEAGEGNPRQLGQLMRRMGELTGERFDATMEEAVRRLESGEDPEKIEEEMGDMFGDEPSGAGASRGAPSYDDGLYDL